MDELFTLIQMEMKTLLEKHLTPHFIQMRQDRSNMMTLENILRQMPAFQKLEEENKALRDRLNDASASAPTASASAPTAFEPTAFEPTSFDCIKLEIIETPKNEAPNVTELYQVANLSQNVENKPTSIEEASEAEASEAEASEADEEASEAEASEAEASEAEASEAEASEADEEASEAEEEEAEEEENEAEPGVEGAEPLAEPLEEEVDIIEIKGHGKFYAANLINSDIYAVDSDGEPGDQVGKFVNKVATFF